MATMNVYVLMTFYVLYHDYRININVLFELHRTGMCTLAYLCFSWWTAASMAFRSGRSVYERKIRYLMPLRCSPSIPIKFLNAPICIECIHFIEYQKTNDFDFYENDDRGRCARFGTKNLVTGDIRHAFARDCRAENKLCGRTGVYYKGWDEMGGNHDDDDDSNCNL